jgi:Heme exporter protein D (CcmD)
MNPAELFSLEARALYLWGAFGAFALAMVLEVVFLRARLRRAAQALRDEQGAAAAPPKDSHQEDSHLEDSRKQDSHKGSTG